ncbi:glucose-6-phosphate isomerase [Candidatus Acetothermia bacterium]|nr:glucose-6-phosphate isomerase [Candidatus Acetothermia bacterium]MBI3643799.1 glucose-6-phosphate isomerase [Candidatus Acetothermia bacterium]
MKSEHVISRLWQRDHTLWQPDPTEISNRLGWLDCPERMQGSLPEIRGFIDEARSAGFTNALLLGMGGSSLAPELFRKVFGVNNGYLDLTVLDSIDPDAIRVTCAKLDLHNTLFIVSSKSGSTLETITLFKHFYNQVAKVVGSKRAGGHFVAITDAESPLAKIAEQVRFRKIFTSDPDIGGRYSALSHFGLVPAALLGMDLEKLLERAMAMACRCQADDDNPATRLGAILGELAIAGRDKLTLIASQAISPFGTWLEQLVAESTGKDGRGILPVIGEALAEPRLYANDRLFVALALAGDTSFDAKLQALANVAHPVVEVSLQDSYDLGAQFFLWEMATAIVAWRLNVTPFNQPDVESAKSLARTMMMSYLATGSLPEERPLLRLGEISVYADEEAFSLNQALQTFLNHANPGDENGRGRSYVALQAYIQPSDQANQALQTLRTLIETRFQLATTVGYGPRFLHSTGQLHKGDAGHGLFIQLTSDPKQDVSIPDEAGSEESSMTFGLLQLIQSLGDRQALIRAKRQVIRFHLGHDVVHGIAKLTEALR